VAVVTASPPNLLWAGVLRRHQALGRLGQTCILTRRARPQQLGNPEIQQFGHALWSDQNVGGFDVAVHYQVAMRKSDGRAYGPEQFDSLPHRERVCAAVLVDAHAIYVFHHEVGSALQRDAAVQHAGDVGVVEARQNLAFHAEAANQLRVGGRIGADQLDRDLAFVFIVGAGGKIYRAHAPVSNAADQPVRPHLMIACRFGLDIEDLYGFDADGVRHQVALVIERPQVAFDFLPQRRIVATGTSEETRAGSRIELQRRAEDVLYSFPAGGIHPSNHRPT